jgi:chondroitin 4-sulfotransferase 11
VSHPNGIVDVVYRLGNDVLPDWFETLRAYRARNDFRRAGVAFVHVPRAAGLSISRTLYNRDIFHFSAIQMQRALPNDVLTLPRFAIVRNPWDRAVSAYHFAKQGGVPGGAQMAHPERYRGNDFATFETFLTRYLARQELSNIDGVFRPQFTYLFLSDGTLPFDHLGRFERLGETEQWLAETLGRPIRLPKINCTDRDDYRGYFTDETREIVADRYRTDIDAFGYRF